MPSLIRSLAATVLVAASGLVWAPPAAAAGCSSSDGVTVVVDFHELGGGLQQVCDGDGGGQKASVLFPENGFPLTYVQRTPGFVCRVSGKPTEDQDPCVNTPPPDAYWGLWWSDGESGTWSYSAAGAGSLTVPEGGAVAFSWNGSSAKSPPGAPPPKHTPEPEPSQQPGPTKQPQPTHPPGQPATSGPGSTSPPAGSSASASPSGSASVSPGTDRPRERARRNGEPDREKRPGSKDPSESPSVEPAPADATATVSAGEAPEPAGDGLPGWVAPVAIGGLFGVAGGAAYLRRRAS